VHRKWLWLNSEIITEVARYPPIAMIRKRLATLATLLVLAFFSSGEAKCNAHYTVLAGDTCSSIISEKHAYLAEVLALNPTLNSACSNLAVGQSVCWHDSSDPSCSTKVVITSGDSCNSLATSHGTSVANILLMNPYLNSGCSNIYVGDNICVSVTTTSSTVTSSTSKKATTTTTASSMPSSSCTKTYTVKSGDTCGIIETNYGLSSAQFSALNPSVNSACSNLAVGQILCVQGSTISTTISATKTTTATVTQSTIPGKQ
jgi:chitinase